MAKTEVRIGSARYPLHSVNTLVIGSGAAALNAALVLHDLGERRILIVTERLGSGTSHDAGSDKQTYYKAAVAGSAPDSPLEMARDLFAGGSMHGDIALCEALGSLPAFFRLTALGIPFPRDRYGAYAGYQTDHDHRQRATSAGPLTSRLMVEAFAREVRRRRIPILERHQVVGLIPRDENGTRRVVGAVALDLRATGRKSRGLVLFNAVNVILGSGGPAGIYQDSVYPESQSGSHGLAFEIGAPGCNLTESQFGIASVKFRWNLSGTYQQVIPRYFSTDRRGRDEKEFLAEGFPDFAKLARAVFLKGYQWPFDPRKIADHGSSNVDLLVHRETVLLGRRVFLDFRRNPEGAGPKATFDFDRLDPEARDYLARSGALLPTPVERLRKMNPPAIELFLSHGIDLEREPLEIRVCAQHNNGGLAANIWWESEIARLFPVGEVNGSHGVYRPGGSALNSGQVGSARAARFIARNNASAPPSPAVFASWAETRVAEIRDRAERMLAGGKKRGLDPEKALREIRRRMTAAGAQVRDLLTIDRTRGEAWSLYRRSLASLSVSSADKLPAAFRALDHALTAAMYLEAIREYLKQGGRSRGSYLVLDPEGGHNVPALGPNAAFSPAGPDDFPSRRILQVRLDDSGRPETRWTDIRPIPETDLWFENVWSEFRAGGADR
ncbi:MAG: FAD-binding protein [Candidatus Aminicenantes bacterium]|nr:FAD-binding protein [Candidatus Aminicenantes bacterium]